MIGPVFSREAITAPRRPRLYATRTLFAAALLLLVLTAWQLLLGARDVSSPGDLSRFAAAVFALVAPLLLTVSVLFSALLSAAAVAQEKDRKTLLLLLLSDLSNFELVLGKLLASLLIVLVAIAACAPILMLLTLLGGVSAMQVLRVLAVTAVASLVAGSLGSTLALWREKTFQTIALAAFGLVLWLILGEVIASGVLGTTLFDRPSEEIAAAISPWRAVAAAAAPDFGLLASDLSTVSVSTASLSPVALFLAIGGGLFVLLNAVAVWRVRKWNPSQEARQTAPEEQAAASQPATSQSTSGAGSDAARTVHYAPGAARPVWDNPVLWREIRTWAYGKKIVAVKLGYLLVFALCAAGLFNVGGESPANAQAAIPAAATPLAPLLVVSVVLVNALAATSITNERDAKALDILLTTDLSPRELIAGKLLGAAYNAKEMIVLPLLLVVAMWATDRLGTENFVFFTLGLLVVYAFAATLGLHAGMMYANSRLAIGASLGTLLFLFLGVTTCMRLMLALSESFEQQLAPFLGFMLGGGIALFGVLAWRNPSKAMFIACFAAPLAVFFAITNFLLGQYGMVFLFTIATCGFAVLAMLIPALSEFNVATSTGETREG